MNDNIKKTKMFGTILAIVVTFVIGIIIGLIIAGKDKNFTAFIERKQNKMMNENSTSNSVNNT